jgi:CSLREA domain-containing protein
MCYPHTCRYNWDVASRLRYMRVATSERGAAVIEEMIRLTTTRTIRGVLLAVLALGAVLLLALPSAPTQAATTFIVNSTGDGADINLTNNRCDASSDVGDQCTLRAAIEEANDTAGADTIEFDIVEGTNPAKTISPTSELPPITDALTESSLTGNNVLSNRIFDNAELGIDLAGGTEDANGVTANDTGDTDTGPNNLQNFPLILSARKPATSRITTISGRLNSNPSQEFVVQCFLTNGAPASAYGEGSRLLDKAVASTDATGTARFSCESRLPFLGQVAGQTVSATAMNVATGDTSEFSKNKTITTFP